MISLNKNCFQNIGQNTTNSRTRGILCQCTPSPIEVLDSRLAGYSSIFKKGTKVPYLYIINTTETWINVFMVLTSYETITR